MEKLKDMLQQQYNLPPHTLTQVNGGWTAEAYEVITDHSAYFLKVYDKNRLSVTPYIERIEDYLPITEWLHEETSLRGKIPIPLKNFSGKMSYEDNNSVYLLYPFIEGNTVGSSSLSKDQINEYASIVGTLHSYGREIPIDMDSLKEDFAIPHERLLHNILIGLIQLPNDSQPLVHQYQATLMHFLLATKELGEKLKKKELPMRLCHTDLHNWNLMQTKEHLILIDWEGLKLSPVEADLRFLIEEPLDESFNTAFIDAYKEIHPDYHVNKEALQFFHNRRQLEDIGEFIQQLLYETLSNMERKETTQWLKDIFEKLETS